MKKLFTLIIVALLATTAAWAENNYVKVTSLDQLVPGKRYILAHQYASAKRNSAVGQMNYTSSNSVGNWNNALCFIFADLEINNSYGQLANVNYIDGKIDVDILNNNPGRNSLGPVTIFKLYGNEENGWAFYAEDIKCGNNGEKGELTGFLSMDPNTPKPTKAQQRVGLRETMPSIEWESDDWEHAIWTASTTNDAAKTMTLWKVVKWESEDLEGEGGYILQNAYDNQYVINQKNSSQQFKLNTSAFQFANNSWNNYRAFLYVEQEEPKLHVSSSVLNLPKETGIGTFSVWGENLTDDVAISLNDGAAEQGFSIDTQTIPASEANCDVANAKVVTVNYSGSAHKANATITVASGEKQETIAVTAQSSAEWTTIYIPKSAGDYYIWAWDANGTIPGQPHNYFENWPGKKINELETANLGNNDGNSAGVEFYKFEYGDNATGLGLVFTEGADGPKTANITPQNHEIYYYDGGTECPTGIPMDNVIFPDETFLKFIKSIKFKSKSGEIYDKPYEYNGYPNVTHILEPEELASIDFMRINPEVTGDLASFKGLEYFTSLKEVSLITDANFKLSVSELDLSMSPSLEKLQVSGTPPNGLPNLTSLKLPDGTLKELELSNCDALPVGNLNQKLATYENLEKLTISSCDLINSLNVEQNYNLTYLYLNNQPIPTLNLDNNSKLEELHLFGTNIGSDNLNANLAKHENLRALSLRSNDNLIATTLDLSKHTELNRLYIMNQRSFESFDLTNNTKINYMVMSGNDNLASLTIPKESMQKMEHLWIEKNGKLMLDEIDLTGNTVLKQISVNFNGKPSTITGVCNQMTGLRYISTEHQQYNGNVLELEGLQEFYHLDVLGCKLDRLNVKNCKALGDVYYRNQETENTELIKRNSNTQIFIADNYLRSLDLTGTYLPYNYNVTGSEKAITNADGEVSYTVVDNPLFSPENYMRHYSYNGQITPELTPNVALVYHDRWAETPNYTYLVYFRLEQNSNDKYPADYEADPSMASEPVLTLNGLFNKEAASRGSDVDNVGFDYHRVKLWSRFAQTQEGPVLDVHGTNEIHALTGVDSPNWDENTTTDLSHVDPTHVLGKVLSLGMYSVPCGHDREYHLTTGQQGTTAYVEPAYISGTVSYLYSTLNWTKEAEVTPDGPSPMPQRDGGTGEDLDVYTPYNGEAITSENDYYKGITVQDNAVVEKYDNAIPFKFDWKVELTNDPESIVTAIKGIHGDLPALIEEIQYYNVMGQMSHKPFEGVNIVVTRYSDGTTTTQKVIR